MVDDDILNDLDSEFEDDMEDILDDSILDDLADLDDERPLEDDPVDDFDLETPSKKENKFKRFISDISDKVPEQFKTKKVMIIAGGAFLFVIIFCVALVMIFSGEKEQTVAGIQDVGRQESGMPLNAEEQIIFEDIVELEPFERIHLKTSSTMGLVNLAISLELTDHRYRKQIYTFEDRIRQIVISQVAEMTWLELRNPDGKIRLKYELLRRINSLFPQATVRNIYFTSFIMQ